MVPVSVKSAYALIHKFDLDLARYVKHEYLLDPSFALEFYSLQMKQDTMIGAVLSAIEIYLASLEFNLVETEKG